MATKALDSEVGKAGARPPISLHPAFPAVVALWFAALLGFGTLLMPPILLDRAVELSGIARFVPAASPPLGFTARGLAAGAAALLGAIVGLVVARQVSRAHTQRVAPRFAPAARRPFSALDELGGEGIAAPGPNMSKRRSLAIAEDSRPSDFLALAPLPGEERYPAVAPERDPEPDVTAPPEAMAEEPLELGEFAAVEISADAEPLDPTQETSMTDDAPVPFPSAEEIERRRAERRASAPTKAPGGLERRLYLRRTSDEAIPFIAPSLARRAPVNENAASDAFAPPMAVRVSFDQSAPDVPSEYVPEDTFELETAAPEDFAQADEPVWETAPLEELGLVQLVQRLGASLERRRELAMAAPEPVAPAVPAPSASAAPVLEEFDAAAAEDAAEAMAAYFGRAGGDEPVESVPVQMFTRATRTEDEEPAPVFARPLPAEPDEPDEDDDLAASFSLPLRRAAAAPDPFADFDEPVAAESAEPDEEPDYGSLLTLRNPFQQRAEEFVRVEEPDEPDQGPAPAVVFPGRDLADARSGARPFDPPAAGEGETGSAPSPAADADAQEALRKALATLQRMSQSG